MSGFGNDIGTASEVGSSPSGARFGSDATPAGRLPHVICTNCGVKHDGDFCPACGQNVHLHRTLSAIGHDLVHGVLHLDGKLWDTLPLLAFRPGELTRRYIAGERVKFVSPMSMFLFTVFAMFAVFQIAGITAPTEIVAQASLPEEMSRARGEIVKRIEMLEKDIIKAEELGEPTSDQNADLAKAKAELRTYDGVSTIVFSKEMGIWVTFKKVGIEKFDSAIDKWKNNPSLMLYKMQANAYKFSWLLIPLSIPFLSLIFLRNRKYNAYDHAVFVTYFLSFISLVFIVCSLLSLIPGIDIKAFLLLVLFAPLHLYVQLRQAYELRHREAIWRFVVLIVSVQIVLIAFLFMLGFIGTF